MMNPTPFRFSRGKAACGRSSFRGKAACGRSAHTPRTPRAAPAAAALALLSAFLLPFSVFLPSVSSADLTLYATNPTRVTASSAYLNGYVTATGSANPEVWIMWSTNSVAVTNGAAWPYTNECGTRGVGPMITSTQGTLTAGTPYYYALYAQGLATNANSNAWSSVMSFQTLSATPAPTSSAVIVDLAGAVIYPTNFWAANTINTNGGIDQAQMDAATGRLATVEGYTNRAARSLQDDGSVPLTGDWLLSTNSGRSLWLKASGGPGNEQPMWGFQTPAHSGDFGLGVGATLQMELYSGGNVYAQWGEQNDDLLAKTNDLNTLETDLLAALNPKLANHKTRLDAHSRTLAESLFAIHSQMTWLYQPYSQYLDDYLTSEARTDTAASTNLAYSAAGDYYEPRWIVTEGATEAAWYKCEDNVGSTEVTDDSGSGQTGAVDVNNTVDMSTENGKVVRGFGISNSTDNAWTVTLTSITGWNYTVAMWASAPDWSTGVEEQLLYFQHTDEGEYSSAELGISYWQGVNATIFGSSHAAAGTASTNVNGLWANDSWHHIVGVFESNNVTLYVDAVLAATAVGTAGDYYPAPWGYPSVLGRSYSGYNRPWRGTMDDVRFYATALTAEQITTLYNSGSGSGDPLGTTATTNQVAIYQSLPWTAALSNNSSTVEILSDAATPLNATNFAAYKAVDGSWSNLTFTAVGPFQAATNWYRWRAETGHAMGRTNALRVVWSNSSPVKVKGWVDWVEEVVP